MARYRPPPRDSSDRHENSDRRENNHRRQRNDLRENNERRENSYRPGNSDDRRHTDTWRPDRGRHAGSRGRPRSAEPLPPGRSAVTKTKHERNTNPSTRIHSLRKQLLRGSGKMPMTLWQEKERELAALLLDQQKTLAVQNDRKNLKRYHFVRFVEGKKAERQLKHLVQMRKSLKVSGHEANSQALEKAIHEAEVDLNYTKYLPLGAKYISLFVEDDNDKSKEKPTMNKQSYAILSEEQRDDLRNFEDELSNVVRSAAGVKPPLWYEVEQCMAGGQEKLDALRDRQSTVKTLDRELTTVGGKMDAALRSGANAPQADESTPVPSWLDDDGIIDPKDLDSDGDENMSDGGFFER